MSRIHRLAAASTAAAVALGTTAAVSAAAGGQPQITSLTAKQHGNAVTVKVMTKDFRIDRKEIGKANKPGMGYERFVLDGGKYDYAKFTTASGKRADKLSKQGRYTASVDNEVTYTGLPKGRYTIVAHLVRNDHVGYTNAGATKQLTFTVR